jgi:hypothetical protein
MHLSELSQNVKRKRPANFTGLELALFEWFKQKRAQGAWLMTDQMVVNKAVDLSEHLGIDNDQIKESTGWLYSFKKRSGIRCYHLQIRLCPTVQRAARDYIRSPRCLLTTGGPTAAAAYTEVSSCCIDNATVQLNSCTAEAMRASTATGANGRG